MGKRIRLIPRHMLTPFIPSSRPIQLHINLPNRNCSSSIVEQVEYSRVPQPLSPMGPRLGLQTDPRRHRHEQRIDTGFLPLIQEVVLVVPFLLLELCAIPSVSLQ